MDNFFLSTFFGKSRHSREGGNPPSTSLSLMDWLFVIFVSSSIWVADEILKRLGVYKKPQGKKVKVSEGK